MHDYKVEQYSMELIYADNEFNCRGPIDSMSVLSLANDIKAKGLDTPISIQPYDKIPGKKYRVLAGHRRFLAFKINAESHIPAFLINITDDFEARNYNLRENLHRADLSILQEAKALQHYFQNGYNIKNVVDAIGKSQGWVEIRKHLLELPKEIQEEAHKGTINQAHIKNLYLIRKNPEKLFEKIRQIKTALANSEKVVVKKEIDILDLIKVRRPVPADIIELLDWMGQHYTPYVGANLTARLAAWVAGNISPLDFWRSIKDDCKERNIPFIPPDHITQAIGSINGHSS